MDDEPIIVTELEISRNAQIVYKADHVHTPGGRCVKRRNGPPCERPDPETKETPIDLTDKMESLKQERDAVKEANRQLRLELKHLRNKVEEIQIICGSIL